MPRPSQQVFERIAGTTLKATWVNSGVSVSSMYSYIRDRTDAVVNTGVVVDSGNGHYFAIHQLPNSAGWYVNEWIARIQGFDYRDRQFIKTTKGEVD